MDKHSKVSIAILAIAFFSMAAVADPSALPSMQMQSPALRQLETDLNSGDQTALESFWVRVAQRHAPLIEEIADRPADALYTFVWRAKPNDDASAVRLSGSFPMHNNKAKLDSLQRLGKSGLWYASYVLPKRAALDYVFVAPYDESLAALANGMAEFGGVKYGLYRDQFNPKTVAVIGAVISYVDGPAATPNVYLQERKNVVQGRIDTIEIESKLLNGRRAIKMYTPAGYNDSRKQYAFMLMYDGDEYTKSIPAPRILDNMIAARAIAPVVVAFFESPDRDRDLFPNDVLQRFLNEELMPQLRAHYRISRDPKLNVVAGFSLGGLAAVYTGFTQPNIFGNVISQSGSLWWGSNYWNAWDYVPGEFLNSASGELIKKFSESPRKPIRIYLSSGEWEEAGGLLPNRLLASVLKGKEYDVSYTECLGGHDSLNWRETLPGALVFVLGSRAHE